MACRAPSLLVAAALVLGAAAGARASSSVVVHGTAAAAALGLDGRGTASTHIVKIAELALATDAPIGFTLTLTSGDLRKADGSTPIPFQVAVVDRDAAAPGPSAFETASGAPSTVSTGGPGELAKDVYIMYRPAALQDPGAYTASIAIDIVDN